MEGMGNDSLTKRQRRAQWWHRTCCHFSLRPRAAVLEVGQTRPKGHHHDVIVNAIIWRCEQIEFVQFVYIVRGS